MMCNIRTRLHGHYEECVGSGKRRAWEGEEGLDCPYIQGLSVSFNLIPDEKSFEG